ncbi:MAG: hypothetical protein KC609_00490 [Myxococcales bacterium]|nr:hypothetical protein [Myxococcales bacterium]
MVPRGEAPPWPALRILLFVVVSTWFLFEALAHPYHLGVAKDWSFYYHHAHTAYLTVRQHGELPVWNPWFCGGIPALGNLQSQAVSPLMLLFLLLGVGPGTKLAALFYFTSGLEGTYRYARHHGAEPVGATLAALLFIFSGRFAQLFVDGHPVFLSLAWTPLALYWLERSFERWRFTLLGGGLVAWIFCDGGVIATPMIGLCLGLVTLGTTLYRASRLITAVPSPSVASILRPIGALGLIALVAAALSAVRLLPVAESLIEMPRQWLGHESYPIARIWAMLAEPLRHATYTAPGTSYLGIAAFGLLVPGLIALDGAVWRATVLASVFFLVSTGDDGPLHLWNGLRALPVVGNLRSPFRFTWFVALFVALGAGRSLSLLYDAIGSWLKRLEQYSPGRALVLGLTFSLVAGLVATPTLLHNRQRLRGLFRVALNRPFSQPFRQSVGNMFHAHVFARIGLGSLACYEDQPFFVSSALRGDREHEEFLQPTTAGRVRRVSWSPHRIVLDVELVRPAVLIVNQNAHRGWQSPQGPVIRDAGRVALALEAGRRRVELRFRDPLVALGRWLSLFSLAGFAVACATAFRRRAPTGDASEPLGSAREEPGGLA